MMIRKLTTCGAATGIGLMLLAGCAGLEPPPTANPDPAVLGALERTSANECNPSVASVLTGAKVPAGSIRGVSYGLYRDINTGRIVRYDAWVGLTDQPGSLVVTVDDFCRPIQIYARGGAALPSAR
ncbi:hypothetical protein [Azospirillum picis]|uniref:Lipoprotein n=1 Tax=Azospirillum picis TaxID=488438 RepID=A0ABU0MLE5_9PROT|nr:hypothetical protein [Azospirillum picis]MBP2301086.1 hypothetical protein [Azospirillum picis]MDQ0534294.1 hypothetical protein [Azospirillum picis]